jgi:hypothetical protein
MIEAPANFLYQGWFGVVCSLSTHSLPFDWLLTLRVSVSLATSQNALQAEGSFPHSFLQIV